MKVSYEISGETANFALVPSLLTGKVDWNGSALMIHCIHKEAK